MVGLSTLAMVFFGCGGRKATDVPEPPQSTLTKDQSEALRKIVDQYRRLEDGLRTWQGEYESESTHYNEHPGLTRSEFKEKGEFLWSREFESAFWRFHRYHEGGIRNDGSTENNRPTFVCAGLFKDSRLSRYTRVDSSSSGSLSISVSPEDDSRPYSDGYNPRDHIRIFGRQISDAVEPYLAPDNEFRSTTVAVEDELVVLESEFTNQDTIVFKYVFDKTKDNSLVEYATDNSSKESWKNHEYEYEQVGGFYLPARVRYSTSRDLIDGATKGFIKEIKVVSQRINEPVSEASFTLQALGLKPGDLVNDRTTGKAYVFGQ